MPKQKKAGNLLKEPRICTLRENWKKIMEHNADRDTNHRQSTWKILKRIRKVSKETVNQKIWNQLDYGTFKVS